jgi:carboxypeptidase Q
VGAHLDSWDLGVGALDDGAGVAIVLATAHRLMQSRPPRRRVRVVLFANEENGEAGARAYVHQHHDELLHHVVAIEADSGDGHVRVARYKGTPAGAVAFERAARLAQPYGVRLTHAAVHGGEDISHLGRAGVPVGVLRQDMSRYFDYHHTANDTPAVLDEEGINQVVAVFSLVVGELASADEDLGRTTEAPR